MAQAAPVDVAEGTSGENALIRPVDVTSLRWVSVLFVDLVGFTAWSEEQDPADVREMLTGYFQAARSVVGRHGGRIEKFIGDAVMAVWGADGARADDAIRAVAAGHDILSAVERYGSEREIQLRARGGVVTGPAAAWEAESEGLVTGDRVNTAARIQAAAAPGEVWIDEATFQSTRGHVDCEPAGELTVKGKRQPLRVWRAIAVASGARRDDAGVRAPLVGRAHELAVLNELFQASVDDGRLRVVVVSGDVGVGKSRLVEEFATCLDRLELRVLWHEGRCLSYGDGVTFWPLAQVIRRRLGIPEGAPPDVVRRALEDGLEQWLPTEEERAFVGPRVAVLLGTGESRFERVDLFAGWRIFLVRLAAHSPVVLLLEDMHWAEEGLTDFLESLIDWSADACMFIVATTQTDLTDAQPQWMTGRQAVARLHLQAMSAGDMRHLIKALVTDLPVDAGKRLIAQAQGIPLYAVETVRAMADRHVLVATDGGLRFAASEFELETPASLSGVIASRLDRLSDDERNLVLGLSVLGGSFSRIAVPAVTDQPPESVERLLRSLTRREILQLQIDTLSPEAGQYRFVQSLVRAVAYDLVPRRQRFLWHASVADHLRAAFPREGEEVAEIVAAHYGDALAAAEPRDKDGMRTQAVAAYERAGQRSGAVGTPEVAVRHYMRAADLASGGAESSRCLQAAGGMAYQAGSVDEAYRLFERAFALSNEADHVLSAQTAACNAAMCLVTSGSIEAAVARLEPAIVSLEAMGADRLLLARAHVRLGEALFELNRMPEAAREIEHALQLTEVPGSELIRGSALSVRGWLMSAENRLADAEASFAAAIVEWSGDYRESAARGNLGELRFQSDLAGAAEEYQRSETIAVRFGNAFMQALSLSNLAQYWTMKGRWSDAESCAMQARAVAADANSEIFGVYASIHLLALQARTAEARGLLERLASTRELDHQQRAALAPVAEAAILLAEGANRRACDLATPTAIRAIETEGFRCEQFRAAWPIAMESALRADERDRAADLLRLVSDSDPGRVPPYIQAQQARFDARIMAPGADPRVVDERFRSATSVLERLGYPYWLARAQLDHALWLSSHGRDADADALNTRAHAQLRRLGAPTDDEDG